MDIIPFFNCIASTLSKNSGHKIIRYWAFPFYKKLIQHMLYPGNCEKPLLFIIGCQRSGTTMLAKIFDRDIQSSMFGELSKIFNSGPAKLRLKALPTVARIFQEQRARFVVFKPLVETQKADNLLKSYKNAKALWVYRNYRDVSLSNTKNFGLHNGIKDLKLSIEKLPKNWRNENISENTLAVLGRFYSPNMNPYDACALFWLARNRLFFELGLNSHPNVRMCNYEKLVQQPAKVMKAIYQWIDIDYPGDWCVGNVHDKSVSKGREINLSPEVELLCQELLRELDMAYSSRSIVRL